MKEGAISYNRFCWLEMWGSKVAQYEELKFMIYQTQPPPTDTILSGAARTLQYDEVLLWDHRVETRQGSIRGWEPKDGWREDEEELDRQKHVKVLLSMGQLPRPTVALSLQSLLGALPNATQTDTETLQARSDVSQNASLPQFGYGTQFTLTVQTRKLEIAGTKRKREEEEGASADVEGRTSSSMSTLHNPGAGGGVAAEADAGDALGHTLQDSGRATLGVILSATSGGYEAGAGYVAVSQGKSILERQDPRPK